MRKGFAWSAVVVSVYFVVWFVTYACFMRGDFAYVPEYFRLGWTGGGELPTAINVVAVSGGVLTLAAVLLDAGMRAAMRKFGAYRLRRAFAFAVPTSIVLIVVLSLAGMMSSGFAQGWMAVLLLIGAVGVFAERRFASRGDR